MRLSFQQFLVIVSGIFLLVAILFSPDIAAKTISGDGILLDATILEVNIWRAVVGAASIIMLAFSLTWKSLHGASWINRIEQDFANWHNPMSSLNDTNRTWLKRASLLVWLIAGAGLVTVWLSFDHGSSDWYVALAHESGVIESLQALFLLIAGLALTTQCWRDIRSGRGRFSLIGLLFGLLLIVGAAEEVSWGQHWLGFETPKAIAEANLQGEFNLHNLGSYWVNHAQLMLFLVYLGLWPAMGYCYPHLHYLLDRMSMPIAPFSILPVVLIGTTMDEHEVIAKLWNYPHWRLSEAREFLFAGSMLMVALLMRRYRRETAKPR